MGCGCLQASGCFDSLASTQSPESASRQAVSVPQLVTCELLWLQQVLWQQVHARCLCPLGGADLYLKACEDGPWTSPRRYPLSSRPAPRTHTAKRERGSTTPALALRVDPMPAGPAQAAFTILGTLGSGENGDVKRARCVCPACTAVMHRFCEECDQLYGAQAESRGDGSELLASHALQRTSLSLA